MIPEERKDGNYARGTNVQSELILEHGELLDIFRKTLRKV